MNFNYVFNHFHKLRIMADIAICLADVRFAGKQNVQTSRLCIQYFYHIRNQYYDLSLILLPTKNKDQSILEVSKYCNSLANFSQTREDKPNYSKTETL